MSSLQDSELSATAISPVDDARTKIAHALGIRSSDHLSARAAGPYITYIMEERSGIGNRESFSGFFADVSNHLQQIQDNDELYTAPVHVQAIIDYYASNGFLDVFTSTSVGTTDRQEDAEDKVMHILGLLTTMLGSFQDRKGSRKVIAAYDVFTEFPILPQTPTSLATGTVARLDSLSERGYEVGLRDLVSGSGLLPGGTLDEHLDAISYPNTSSQASKTPDRTSMHTFHTRVPRSAQTLPMTKQSHKSSYRFLQDMLQESLSIKAIRLNAYTLQVLGAVDISWTANISRHMLLTKIGERHVLDLFSLPCAFESTGRSAIGIDANLVAEIELSYAMLFNAWSRRAKHQRLRIPGLSRVCWCWKCSARRFRRRCIVRHKTECERKGHEQGHVPSTFDPRLDRLSKMDSVDNWTPEEFQHLWPRIARLDEHLRTSKPWGLRVLFQDRRDTVQFWTFAFATLVVILTIVQVGLGITQAVGSFN